MCANNHEKCSSFHQHNFNEKHQNLHRFVVCYILLQLNNNDVVTFIFLFFSSIRSLRLAYIVLRLLRRENKYKKKIVFRWSHIRKQEINVYNQFAKLLLIDLNKFTMFRDKVQQVIFLFYWETHYRWLNPKTKTLMYHTRIIF